LNPKPIQIQRGKPKVKSPGKWGKNQEKIWEQIGPGIAQGKEYLTIPKEV